MIKSACGSICQIKPCMNLSCFLASLPIKTFCFVYRKQKAVMLKSGFQTSGKKHINLNEAQINGQIDGGENVYWTQIK